jgi:hypothetical protein
MNQGKKGRKKQGKRIREKIQNWYAAHNNTKGEVGIVRGWGEVKKLGSIQGVLP